MISKLTRRDAMALIGASVLATPAAALSDGEARALINRAVADVNTIIASGKSEAAMIKSFEKLFVRYGDVPIIARSALGADARSASSSQLKSYTRAFQGYMARKYGRRFREFAGGKIEVKSSRKVKSFYEVKSVAKLPGRAPFELVWLVSDKSGKNKFFDLIIEGISLRLSEKSEIGAMLDKRGGKLDLLIKDLKTAG